MFEKLKIGQLYSKQILSSLLNEVSLKTVREGIFYCKNSDSTLFFVDLEKQDKPSKFHFNNYFDKNLFHLDSQTTQHINSPKIQEIVNTKKKVYLFCREIKKIKGKTQPFVYCGTLKFIDYDKLTSKPVHMVFESIDFQWSTNNDDLLNLYTWSPNKVGGKSSNSKSLIDKVEKFKKIMYSKPNVTERQGLVTSRVGQGWYRQEILKRWNYRCSVTNCNLTKILISSHIVPWSESNDDEKLDVGNGILLIPNLDSLFDKYLISFKDDGGIILSKHLNDKNKNVLGISTKMKLNVVFKDMKKYLKRHRKKFFEKSGIIV